VYLASEKLGENKKLEETKKEARVWKKEEIKAKAEDAEATAIEISEEMAMYHPASALWTDTNYQDHVLLYQKEVNSRKNKPKKKAVLLDLFGGIGGGLVVLKRLKIGLSKVCYSGLFQCTVTSLLTHCWFQVIHVEHDKVATHVTKLRHDPAYNSRLADDGIEHVYISTFEELEKDVDDFCNQHGREF
jgi:hypothetical protein